MTVDHVPAEAARPEQLAARLVEMSAAQGESTAHRVRADRVDPFGVQDERLAQQGLRLVGAAEDEQRIGCVAAAPDALAALQAQLLHGGDAAERDRERLVETAGVEQHGAEVDDHPRDVVDVVGALPRDLRGGAQLLDAAVELAQVGQRDPEVVAGAALGGATVGDLPRQVDRPLGLGPRLVEPAGQHQHLRVAARDGGLPAGDRLGRHQFHGSPVGLAGALAVGGHPEVTPQPFVQVGVVVPLLRIDARDGLPDQCGGAVGRAGEMGRLGGVPEQPVPGEGRSSAPSASAMTRS